MNVLLLLGVAGLVLGFIWWRGGGLSIGTGSGFVIRHRPGAKVEVSGRLTRHEQLEIQDFCDSHLTRSGRYAIRGTWTPGRRLLLRYEGDLDASQRQRVRNFLTDCLN